MKSIGKKPDSKQTESGFEGCEKLIGNKNKETRL
jgi:hypothetical protein